jgi:hypothetical protein
MLRVKTLGLALVAVFAFSAVVASAFAAAPAFVHCVAQAGGKWEGGCLKEKASGGFEKVEVAAGVGKLKFTSTSGAGKMEAAGTVIECKKDTDVGEITGAKTVGAVVVTFTECEGTNGTKKCKVKSKGSGTEGKVVTKELTGELGEVAAAESTTEVGERLKPTSGSTYVELEGTCLPISPAPVTGAIIGEVTPTKSLSTTGKLVYTIASKKQKIQKFKGGSAEVLKVFGIAEAPLETTDTVTFEEAIEV